MNKHILEINKILNNSRYVSSICSGSLFDICSYPLDPDKPILWIQAKTSQLAISNFENYFKDDIAKIRTLPSIIHNEFYIYLKINYEGQEKWKIEKDRVIKLE